MLDLGEALIIKFLTFLRGDQVPMEEPPWPPPLWLVPEKKLYKAHEINFWGTLKYNMVNIVYFYVNFLRLRLMQKAL